MSLQLTNNVSNVENEGSSFIDMVNNYDWSSTPLGPMDSWEPQIKSLINLCLKSEFPTTIFLSPEWIMIYNEASIPVLKSKHAFGKPVLEVCPESYDGLISALERVKSTGKGVLDNNFYLELQRDGYIEEVYFNYTFSPIFKLDGTFWGAFNITSEVTQKVLNVRRLKTLESLGRQTADAKSLESVCHIITKILKDDNKDIPYAFIYLVESNNGSKTVHKSSIARLVSTTFDEEGRLGRNIPDYLPETHESIELNANTDQNCDSTSTNSPLKCNYWPIHLVMKEGKHVQVLLEDGSQAILLPTKLSFNKEQGLSAILIFGLNPRRRLDDQYMDFLQV
ncbi:protein-histidine kinase [Gigaspora margarita]|uniref:Protein-histidine kinase n=1 Tax=Gigaspora margarita TaxID=4874 RepID=A0A8H4B1S2_GIGMA|nr:protein-histidine kinase [Gigaspora margarita]